MTDQIKTISVDGRTVVVHSHDGRSWAMDVHDLEAFERRVAREQRELQAAFARIDTGEERVFEY